MDKNKLDALRRKYANAAGGEIFDPDFAAVGRQVFGNAERRKWPFSDPATFLGTAFRPDAAALPGFGGVDVVGGDVVEVAPQYDATTNTAQIAAQALFELLCLVAGSRRERQRGKT